MLIFRSENICILNLEIRDIQLNICRLIQIIKTQKKDSKSETLLVPGNSDKGYSACNLFETTEIKESFSNIHGSTPQCGIQTKTHNHLIFVRDAF